jgi:hypothetical protein
MGWNGSGTHNRIHNFSADASAGIQAQAVRFDAEFDDISTALENCQTLDGQTTPTANSPMGGFKHTGVAAATSTDNYLRADQHSQQVGIFVRDVNTGVTGKMTASASPFPTAFSEGQRVTVKVSANGSAAANRAIVVNGLSANIIDNQGSAIPASKMLKDGYFDLVYDASASAFRVLTPRNDDGVATSATVAALTSTTALRASSAEIDTGTEAVKAIAPDQLTLSDNFGVETSSTNVTWTGFTTSASSTFVWLRQGRTCIMNMQTSLLATSNSSACTVAAGGLPAKIRPRGETFLPVIVVDTSVESQGWIELQTNGGIELHKTADVDNNGFTASGTKGMRSNVYFTYRLSD